MGASIASCHNVCYQTYSRDQRIPATRSPGQATRDLDDTPPEDGCKTAPLGEHTGSPDVRQHWSGQGRALPAPSAGRLCA